MLLGAFLCLNLALAIIAAAFEDQAEEAKAGHEAEAEAAAEAADGEEVEKPECSLNPFSEGQGSNQNKTNKMRFHVFILLF